MNDKLQDFSIEELMLEDFRCFKCTKVLFNSEAREVKDINREGANVEVSPLTVLVAKNGMGKTAILDAIRILFGTYTSAFPSKSIVHADSGSIRLFRDENGHLKQAPKLKISGKVRLHGQSCKILRELSSDEGSRTTSKDAKELVRYATELKKKETANLPILAYYGTGRLWVASKETRQKRMLLKRRDYGYKDCLSVAHNFKAVNWWLTQAVQKRSLDKSDLLVPDDSMSDQLDAIKSALDCVLVHEGYNADITYDAMTQTLAIRKQIEGSLLGLPMPIGQLSDGVKATWGLFADIAFRCAKLNPHLGKEAPAKTTGVVLIDEIDLHLHPSWQQTILNTLQLAFPRIQFIVTTHSPQVVSAVPKMCVRVVEPDVIDGIDSDTEGARSSQVLEDVFSVPSRVSSAVSRVTQFLDEYRNLVKNGEGNTQRGCELKAVLNDLLPSDPELTELSLEVLLQDYKRRHQCEASL